MVDIVKTVPNELDGDSKYSIRIRSINSFGVSSAWSEALVVDTSAAGLASAGRLIITEDGMVAYDDSGQLVFGYYSSTSSRTNEVRNPSFESNLTGWQGTSTANATRSTTTYFFGQTGLFASALVTPNANNVSNVGIEQSIAHRFTAAPASTWTISAYVKPSLANRFVIGLKFYNGGGTLLQETFSSKEQSVSPGVWSRITAVALKAPAGTATAAVVIKSVKPMATAENFYVDGVLAEAGGLLREYFDGSTSLTNTTWSGAANASASQFLVEALFNQNQPTITEGIIQTNPNVELTGGIKLQPNGLFAYNPSGTQKVSISALTGDITAVDGTFTGSTFQTGLGVGTGSPNALQGVIFNINGIKGYSGAGTVPSFELNTSGAMTARSGAIGGWTINPSTLANNNVTLDSNGRIVVGTGNNVAVLDSDEPGDWRVWVGHATGSLAAFRVRQDGTLFATGAFISGELTATTGSIGGWAIGATTLTGGDLTLDSNGEITLGTGNNVIRLSDNGTYRLWAGHANAVSAPFTVSQTGAMNASAGSIGGVLIANDELYVGSGGFKAGVRAATSPGDWMFYAGNSDPALAPYRVSNEGKLVASSGFIGDEDEGWEIHPTYIRSTGSASSSIYLEGSNVSNNPRIYILDENATPSTPGFGTEATSFYADSLGQFSLKDKLLFDPGNAQTGGLGALTVIGKIRGAIENYEIFQLDKGQQTPTNAVLNADIVTLTFAGTHGFAVGDTILNDKFAGIYAPMNGAWRVLTTPTNATLTFALTNANIASGSPGVDARTRVREMTMGIHPQMTSPDGGIISPAGLGIRLDEYNYWFVNNKFRVGTSNAYLNWDGINFTVKGTILADAGQFLGYVTAGTARIGADVSGSNDGLWMNTDNYWYDTGAFKVGGGSQYVQWNGSTLTIAGTLVGGLVRSANYDPEDTGTPTVWFSDAGTQIDLTTGNIITPGIVMVGATGAITAKALQLADENDRVVGKFTSESDVQIPGGNSGTVFEMKHGDNTGTSYLRWSDETTLPEAVDIALGTPLAHDFSYESTIYSLLNFRRDSIDPEIVGRVAVDLVAIMDYDFPNDFAPTARSSVWNWRIYFTGVTGNYATYSNTYLHDNDSISMTMWLYLSDWTPALEMIFASQWTSTGNQKSWRFGIQTDGKLFADISTDGSTSTRFLAPSVTPGVNSGWKSIRISFFKGTAGTPPQATFAAQDINTNTELTYYSPFPIGAHNPLGVGVYEPFTVTQPVMIGASDNGTVGMLNALVHYFSIEGENGTAGGSFTFRGRDIRSKTENPITKTQGISAFTHPFSEYADLTLVKAGSPALNLQTQSDRKEATISVYTDPYDGSSVSIQTSGRQTDPKGSYTINSTNDQSQTIAKSYTKHTGTSTDSTAEVVLETNHASDLFVWSANASLASSLTYSGNYYVGRVETYTLRNDFSSEGHVNINTLNGSINLFAKTTGNARRPPVDINPGDLMLEANNIHNFGQIYQNGAMANSRYFRNAGYATFIPQNSVYGIDFNNTLVSSDSWNFPVASQTTCLYSGMYNLAATVTASAAIFPSGTFLGIYFVGIGMYARTFAARTHSYETLHISHTTYCPAGLTISFVFYHEGAGGFNSFMVNTSNTITDPITPAFEIVRVS